MSKIAVYTCITGAYELPVDEQPFDEADFFLFTDDLSVETRWKKLKAVDLYKDPRRNARYHKLLPQLFFPDYDYTIWIDGSVKILCPIKQLIKEMDGADIYTFTHPNRRNVYDEARECIRLFRDFPRTITEHLERIFENGYPDNQGLAETRVMVRKNNNRVNEFNKEWFYQLSTGSVRDQISFNYSAWETGMKIRYMPAISNGNRRFENIPHVKTTYEIGPEYKRLIP